MVSDSPDTVENPVAPQTHGVGANFVFADNGLSPYWGMVDAFEPDLSDRDSLQEIVVDGFDETFSVGSSVYWRGKLADPNGDRDGGLYEYKLSLWSNDEPEAKGIDATFRAGYPDATHADTGDEIGGIPDDCPESIRVQVEASNVEPDNILVLLRALADAIGLDADYFRTPHSWSSVYKLETYIRVDRAVATRDLSGSDGTLEKLALFGNGDGRGSHTWDHEEITAAYESVALDPDTWSRLIPEQSLAKYLKVYQPDHVRDDPNGSDDDNDDPLVHHKLESRYWSDYSQDSLSWSAVDDHLSELRATALNALSWSDIDLSPDADHFIADEYFSPVPLQDDVDIVADPLDDVRDAEQLGARADLVDPDASVSEFDVLETVVSDGGPRHYQELSEIAGTSESTVYRAVDQFDRILEADDGEIRFTSENVRKSISEVLERFESAKNRAVSAIRKVANRERPLSRDLDDDGAEPTALEKWVNRHAVEARTRINDSLEFSFTDKLSRRELLEILRDGLQAAEISPLLTKEFERARVDYIDENGEPHRNLRVATRDGHQLRLLGVEPVD